ncbi:MAG TPA: bifunctional DNA-binding transcriptional regulator/O6-methylguanine-DNA methyltransferase Ada [Gemmatimonadales bacterium]|nr:bifunctional DNA-binding transcriptional regulator/O6-methylguanine-DNA methyltransferase Ada [Gemmatimonadales bacterium]
MTSAAVAPSLNPTHQWRIVLARDRRYDGDFVYAVRSTGIYCRPSCPSRRPRRTLVRFFPIPEAAEAAGFRACRRCHPGRLQPHDPAVALVRDVCRAIDVLPDGPADLTKLGRLVDRSPHQVLRAFRRVLGVSPREYRDAKRVSRLKSSLKEMPHVSPAIYEAGFGSSSRVYERAAGALGMTPATYARGGRGAAIRYSVVPSPLGTLLVAATERGICKIALGDTAAALERDLRREFPASRISRDAGTLGSWVELILAHLAGSEPHLDLPLDIRATAFQQKVWNALRKIPYGSTRSYQAVARAIGSPSATRAVARACATNPVALVIPCHRVVREDGQPGGYRWGTERKEALLKRETDAQESGRR